MTKLLNRIVNCFFLSFPTFPEKTKCFSLNKGWYFYPPTTLLQKETKTPSVGTLLGNKSPPFTAKKQPFENLGNINFIKNRK